MVVREHAYSTRMSMRRIAARQCGSYSNGNLRQCLYKVPTLQGFGAKLAPWPAVKNILFVKMRLLPTVSPHSTK